MGKSIVVYLDNILVHSATIKKHMLHFKEVFQALQDNRL